MHMRRSPYVQQPRCGHRQAIWDAYEAECEQRREQNAYTGWPKQPEGADGYCEPCFKALWAADSWPAEIWEYLHHSARELPKGSGHLLKPYKLPGYPKPRREVLAKLLARAAAKYTLTEKEREAETRIARLSRCDAAIGKRCGDGWYIDSTNGHCAIVRRGERDERTATIIPADLPHWIDLSEAFYFALQRIRLFSNERSEAVRLTSYGDGTVQLYAKSVELGEAWETVTPVRTSGGELPEYETCLNASYLDAALGVWPLRWYLRPPEQRDRTADRRLWIEELPQVFEPAGAEWRAVIMPMQI